VPTRFPFLHFLVRPAYITKHLQELLSLTLVPASQSRSNLMIRSERITTVRSQMSCIYPVPVVVMNITRKGPDIHLQRVDLDKVLKVK